MSILIFFANDLDHQNITIVLQMIHIILIGRKLAMWSANDPENGMARCDSSFLQMVRQKGRPGATVLFCKCSGTSVCAGLLQKMCFGATTFIANYEQHHDGPASCHAIADGIVFAIPDRPAACRKDGLPEYFFCILIAFVRSFEEPVARKRRSSGRH